MKKKRAVMITVLGMFLVALFQPATNAENETGKDPGTIPSGGYSTINEMLSGSVRQGKLAGQTDMEGAFATDSGGIEQQIQDSVDAEEDMGN